VIETGTWNTRCKDRQTKSWTSSALERLAEAQGLVMWVRVRSPEKEAEAQEILVRHGAEGSTFTKSNW
jgi:hypothetical protein